MKNEQTGLEAVIAEMQKNYTPIEVPTFTQEGQVANNISWTTKQKHTHPIYRNLTVTICELRGHCMVWKDYKRPTGTRSICVFDNLTIDEACVEANKIVQFS